LVAKQQEMKNKIAYAVFTKTDSGSEYMVKGNFGTNQVAANKWAGSLDNLAKYHNGLFVKLIKY
jgi:hypothetical protein